MANYVTRAELRSKLTEAGYVAATDPLYGTTADDDRADFAIREASALVDSQIGRRYALPITDTTALGMIWPHALALAVGKLLSELMTKQLSEKSKQAYDRALTWIEEIGSGAALLQGAETIEAAADSAGGASPVGGEDRIYTLDALKRLR